VAWASANGADVLEARVQLPRLGAWHADLSVDSDKALTGKVALSLNGFALSGFVHRGGVLADTAILRVVGGLGGLPRAIEAKAFRGTPVRTPLAYILQTAGETLSPRSDNGVLSTQLPVWVLQNGICAEALAMLVAQVDGAIWRVLPDGTVWVGLETWPASKLTDYDLLTTDPAAGKVLISADVPSVVPGTVFEGLKVSYVQHVIGEDALRTEVWGE
jgi:hypothetical protein